MGDRLYFRSNAMYMQTVKPCMKKDEPGKCAWADAMHSNIDTKKNTEKLSFCQERVLVDKLPCDERCPRFTDLDMIEGLMK